MATSFPAETETCFPVIVLPTASSWFNWNWSNVFVLDNTPRDLLYTDTSIANVCRPSSMETLFFADNATVPFTLLMSPWRMLISLPEAKTTLPCVWIWLPISAVWWTWRWFLSLNSPYVSWFSVRTVLTFKLFCAMIRVAPCFPALLNWAPRRFTSFFACKLNVPLPCASPCTYTAATRSNTVLPLRLSPDVLVVLFKLMLFAFAWNRLPETAVPPLKSILSVACKPIFSACKCPECSISLALIATIWRAPIVPPFCKVPLLIFKWICSAPIRLPDLVKSPFLATTYTFGTHTVCVEPSGKVTVCVSSHTISLVKRDTCSADKAIPNVKPNSCAAVTPLCIKALNCSSSLR